ncbi:leucine-rich repeat-containing protein 52-like [Erpetoichthys calabaricus]|uniref:leucine-rich repeat-containing protein 52-like n=1 Tax=Erpetoichthys calabaricus TaxID=27687 RepID=UPI002233EBD5|nr:leucine-rich repeat-containing protein 52-like [Erpetoichthys calabaricus]
MPCPRCPPLPLPLVLLLLLCGHSPLALAIAAGCPTPCTCDDQLVVQCSGRRLTEMPPDIPLATRQLLLSNNRIAELPPLRLNYLADLTYLDCSNNSLAQLSDAAFVNLKKLAYLDLSFNDLEQVDNRTFQPLESLVVLRLTDNPRLRQVPGDAFVANTALQVLDLSRNNLSALEIGALLQLPTLRSVALSGNPWECDCDVEDLCLWMQLQGAKFQDEVSTVCRGPELLSGSRLSEVGMQLRADCHQGLDHWDYLFFFCIGFIIFSGGTLSAWVMGVLMVLYDRYEKKHQGGEEEEEEEGGGDGGSKRGNQGGLESNGDLSKTAL